MLDIDTKRRIDTARDILVGKLPDPKSQVEQITIALIYKFMDDMDAEAEELGGQRKFFAGEYARYGWAKLMRSGLGGYEVLSLYADAIGKMQENPGIPPLFRDIFKNAFLPYRDPETLRAFLKIIDEFEYDHSERLGDAFEYLLSVLGSQGDAGQFRTPRHIIDFIVEIVDPKKHEIVLDPACGTAGFLISSFKHILKANTAENGHSTLSPDDRARLAANFKGYDISPDMVRLSLVNMYLHGFPDPHIFEYDTLTSQDRWNEYADVILANPPFMSPKGGIKPHNRFSVQSKRSEVLFVDYIAEHLKPGGRAGIIVPEGIIFQSQSAYTQLRKMLVENYLVAVVSLPAGVFNPYSSVKTSILILDKALARQTDRIAFFKIENDGFSLGAQRRPIDKDNLPQARAEITEYLRRLRARESLDGFRPTLGDIVPKERIAGSEEYNLSGERYRENGTRRHAFPLVPLSDVCTINPSKSEGLSLPTDALVSFVPMSDLGENTMTFSPRETRRVGDIGASYTYFADGDVLVAKVTPCFENGKAGVARNLMNGVGFGSSEFYVLRPSERVLPEFLYFCVTHDQFRKPAIAQMTGTGGLQRVPRTYVEQFQIPLPPLDLQKEIVAEIEGYQKVVDGARAVLDNYRPHVPIDPEWPMERFGNVTSTITPPKKIQKADFQQVGRFPVIDQSQAPIAGRTDDDTALVDATGGLVIFGDHTCAVKFVDEPFAQGADGIKIIRVGDCLLPKFVFFYLLSHPIKQEGYKRHFGKLSESGIPVPPLQIQSAIVAEIEAEQALVNANRELIVRIQKKTQAMLARVWGEDEQVLAGG
jgi:type I restriction enzyme M protein